LTSWPNRPPVLPEVDRRNADLINGVSRFYSQWQGRV
jgi:hypothetical protein